MLHVSIFQALPFAVILNAIENIHGVYCAKHLSLQSSPTRCIEQGAQRCVAKSPEDASFCAIALFFIATINKLSPSTQLKMIHTWLLAPLALECVHICAVTLTAPPIWQESLVIANHGAAQHQFWPMAINRKGLCQMVKTVHSRTSHHWSTHDVTVVGFLTISSHNVPAQQCLY